MWLPLVCPLLGNWPATQACALNGNRTSQGTCLGPHSIHQITPARAHSKSLEVYFLSPSAWQEVGRWGVNTLILDIAFLSPLSLLLSSGLHPAPWLSRPRGQQAACCPEPLFSHQLWAALLLCPSLGGCHFFSVLQKLLE